jgi:sugar lactone lactonase YvrE
MVLKRRRMETLVAAVIAAAALAGSPQRAEADVLYASTSAGNSVVTVNTATGSVTPLFTVTNPPPDRILFLSPSTLLYLAQGDNNVAGSGQLRSHNLVTNADTLVAGNLSRPADLALDPGGATALVSESSIGTIARVNLSTGVVTPLATTYPIPSGGIGPNGLTYDAVGRLFANIGDRLSGPTGSNVAQIDPVTGAIIHQTTGLNSVDGLAFDPFSGRLFAPSTLGSVLYSINPNNLADVTSITLPGQADGAVANGQGLVFIGGRGTNAPIYQYSDITGMLTTVIASVPGATAIDLAAIPEPSVGMLAGVGGLVVLAFRYLRRTGTAR